MNRAASALLGVLLGAGFYLLLIDTVQLPEVYAGLGATLLAGLAFEVSREQGFAEASLAPAWLLGGRRVLWRLPTQIWLVSLEAVLQLVSSKRRRGEFRAVRFRAGGEGSRDVGRRALTEALGSLTPNTIVIGIDPDRDLLLVHQLHVQGGREELDVLELG
jgi:multisubunit Na+/H+ antiporter MnhE subunit